MAWMSASEYIELKADCRKYNSNGAMDGPYNVFRIGVNSESQISEAVEDSGKLNKSIWR
jgi:hypothetical protein